VAHDPNLVAHTPPDEEPDKWQSMHEHTNNVAQLAAAFAKPFGAEELALWCGWLHDVGKYSDDFQKYLRDCAAGVPRKPGSAEHKCAGTKLARVVFPGYLGVMASACVLGHHGGLQERDASIEAIARAEQEQRDLVSVIDCARADFPSLNDSPPTPANLRCFDNLPIKEQDRYRYIEMLSRFVFSCLVDADSLDTEKHFQPTVAYARTAATLTQVVGGWLATLKDNQEELQTGAQREAKTDKARAVNRVRSEVYAACLAAAPNVPGVFTLTVPTGGGKTRSSLAFALAHAAAHAGTPCKRSRIIYAIPYTSIVDQTAREFGRVLGPDAVVEHHSAVEARDETKNGKDSEEDKQVEDAREQRKRLASDNWAVPLVVTTTVQLFESLFGRQTGKCRKVHNLADSIVILDEVQTLPPFLLTPLLDGLKTLVERFGATVVLCTATQPAITGDTPFLKGLGEPHPIIAPDKRAEHFKTLRRVTYRPIKDEQWDWARTAQEITDKNESVLAVLNTKKDALALLKTLREQKVGNVQHLSTYLCNAHRRVVLEGVKDDLKSGRRVYLVATQVIEAGVDIDFPHVFRAKGPLDRIIQAAGRCNREGERDWENSEVVIFDPLDGTAPPGVYQTAIGTAWPSIIKAGFDFDDPDVATAYFAALYGNLGRDALDKYGVQVLRAKLNFPEVARQVRLIQDDTFPVLVPCHNKNVPGITRNKKPFNNAEFDQFVDALRERRDAGKSPTRDQWREIQPFTVALFRKDVERHSSTLETLVEDQLYLWRATYDPILGIGDQVGYAPEDLIISNA